MNTFPSVLNISKCTYGHYVSHLVASAVTLPDISVIIYFKRQNKRSQFQMLNLPDGVLNEQSTGL